MSLTMDQLSSTENWPASQSGESSASDSKNVDNLKNLELSNDLKTIDTNARAYGLIAEEPEETSKSDSIEQLSESINKIESVCKSYGKDSRKQENVNNNDSLKVRFKKKHISKMATFNPKVKKTTVLNLCNNA